VTVTMVRGEPVNDESILGLRCCSPRPAAMRVTLLRRQV
jgi:hypothetical protein